jgi:hypothetical protein
MSLPLAGTHGFIATPSARFISARKAKEIIMCDLRETPSVLRKQHFCVLQTTDERITPIE